MDIANLIIRVTNEGLDAATRELDRLNNRAQGAQSSAEKFGKSISTLNKVAMVGFGALSATVGASIKTAIDFEKAMAGVAKTVDFATDNGLANMKKGIEDLTKTIPLAFEELAEIASIGGQLGVVEDDILGFTETIAKMGVAFDISAGEAADSMAKIAGVYQIPISNINELGDTINAVSNSMAATASDVINFMARVGGSSQALGLAADDVAALGGAFSALGMAPEVAGTAFNIMIAELAKVNAAIPKTLEPFAALGLDTKEFAETIRTDGVGAIKMVLEAAKEIGGLEAYDALGDAFGAQGAKIATIAEGYDTVTFALEQVGMTAEGVSKTAGSMTAEFESVSSTTANKMQLVQNNIRLVAAAVGEAFLPAVNDLLAALVPVIERINEWASANPDLIVKIAAVTGAVLGAIIALAAITGAVSTVMGAISGLTAIFTGLITAIKFIGGAMAVLASPVALLVGAIALIGVMGYMVYANWQDIVAGLSAEWDKLVGFVEGVVESMSAAWDSAVDYTLQVFADIGAGIAAEWQKVKDFTAAIWGAITENLSAAWDSIVSVISAGWEAIVYAFQNPAETLSNVLDFLWENFKQGAIIAFTALVEIFVGGGIDLYKAVIRFGENVVTGFNDMVDKAINLFHSFVDGLGNAWQSIKDTTSATVEFLINAAVAGFNALVDGAVSVFNSLLNFLKNTWESIKNVFKVGLEVIVNTVSSGIEKIKWFFDGGWKDILATVQNFAKSMVEKVKDAFSKFVTAARDGLVKTKNTVTEKIGEILAFFAELPSKMFNFGRDFIMGFANGIKAFASNAWSAAKVMAKGAVDIVQKTIDSHSPAKTTEREGKNFSDGMAKGIKKGTKAVKSEAQKMAESAIDAVQKTIIDLQEKLDLFGNESKVKELDYRVNRGDFKGVPQAMLDKQRVLTVELERTTLAAKEHADAVNKMDSANKSVMGSIEALEKNIALFGDTTALASLRYDILNTDKYKDADEAKLERLVSLTREYQNMEAAAKAANAIQERFAKLEADKKTTSEDLDNMMKGIESESPLGKLQNEYAEKIAIIEKYEQLHTDMVEKSEAARLATIQWYMDGKRDIMLNQSEALFGNLADLAKGFAGEQSAAYKALFAVEKSFAIAQAGISIQKAISKAMEVGFPTNVPLIGEAITAGGKILSTIRGIQPKGFKSGGYTGNGGSNRVAGVVHGKEYVFDAQSTKEIGVDNLNALRSGRKASLTPNVNITVNIDANGNSRMTADGADQVGKELAKNIERMVINMMQKEKRQGGMLSGR